MKINDGEVQKMFIPTNQGNIQAIQEIKSICRGLPYFY